MGNTLDHSSILLASLLIFRNLSSSVWNCGPSLTLSKRESNLCCIFRPSSRNMRPSSRNCAPSLRISRDAYVHICIMCSYLEQKEGAKRARLERRGAVLPQNSRQVRWDSRKLSHDCCAEEMQQVRALRRNYSANAQRKCTTIRFSRTIGEGVMTSYQQRSTRRGDYERVRPS